MTRLSMESLQETIRSLMDVNVITLHPTKLLVYPENYRMALKVLRGRGWHYKNTARWRYLQRRGARK